MVIPIWAIIAGSVILYVAIGVAHGMISAYMEGRKPGSGFTESFGSELFILFWPPLDCVLLAFGAMLWYSSLLERVEQRGRESVMPPKNECSGRRIEEPKADSLKH